MSCYFSLIQTIVLSFCFKYVCLQSFYSSVFNTSLWCIFWQRESIPCCHESVKFVGSTYKQDFTNIALARNQNSCTASKCKNDRGSVTSETKSLAQCQNKMNSWIGSFNWIKIQSFDNLNSRTKYEKKKNHEQSFIKCPNVSFNILLRLKLSDFLWAMKEKISKLQIHLSFYGNSSTFKK